MSRQISLFAIVLGAVALAGPATAADYYEYPSDLRGSIDPNWDLNDAGDPIGIEFGIRYWYSMGAHQMTVGGGDYSANDTSHIVEGHVRIDDYSTSSYLKANAGFAAAISGTYDTPQFGTTQTMQGGHIGYAGADFGYMPFGNDLFRFGGFAGYQYSNDSPDMGRANFTTSSGGGDSQTNNIEFNTLRLGVVGRAEVSDLIDINVEAAAIPWSRVRGTYGAFYQGDFVSGGNTYTQGSAGTLEGNLYGAAGEIMVGFHPTDSLVLRVGGRASYLTGPATMTYTARRSSASSTEQNYIFNTGSLSFLRYGLLAELTGSF